MNTIVDHPASDGPLASPANADGSNRSAARTAALSALAILLAGNSIADAATLLPLELRMGDPNMTHNLQSQRGVPISATAGIPPGSDGRMPSGQNESGSYNPGATNQFASLIAFGGGPGLTLAEWQAVGNSAALKGGVTPFSGDLAVEIKRPLGRASVADSSSPIVIVQRQAQIGGPFECRRVSCYFGSIVAVPEKDETGAPITHMAKEAYWLPEPYSINRHTNAPYYWSPHARMVYAVQPGPITVTWQKAAPYTVGNVPAYVNANGVISGTPSFITNAGNVFLLHTARYFVSGSPVKPPRRMYWTEGVFRDLGKTVAVPKVRVPGGLKILYNSTFPKTVVSEYAAPGQSTITDGTTNQTLPNLRTLYVDDNDGYLHAYNAEGRAFVELLGDSRPDGQSRQSLGFEIVDVSKQPIPAEVTTELGERLEPPPPGSPDELTPDPVNQGGLPFVYEHPVAGSDRLEIFAIRATANPNDCLVHWLETGEQRLLWPAQLGRYALVWPSDVARYSHYVRPVAPTENEAKQTAIALATETVPIIEYQDAFDFPRAKLTEEFKFYTWLDQAHPAHRTLLRFTAGEYVAFDRVFSWLDAALLNTNLTLPAFATDFATASPGAAIYGDAAVAGGILHLTDAAASQIGVYALDDFNGGGRVENFRATFNVSLRNAMPWPAEGFSFNFGSLPDLHATATSVDTAAMFNGPRGVAVDSAGNAYVADWGNHRIRKVTRDGVATTLAGSGAAGYADGTGTAARFNFPHGVAVDGAGNVYVADQLNHRVRKVTPAGVVTTLAGSGVAGYADGTGPAALFNQPIGVAVDSAGNVSVADWMGHSIRKVTPAGGRLVTTYNPFTDFSTNRNPNGVWSYGWMETSFGSLNLYTNGGARPPGAGEPCWWRSGTQPVPGVWMGGTIGLHPGGGWEPSVVRWTAPCAGTVTVQGQFLPGDVGIMTVGVRRNNQPWWSASDAGAFNLTTNVAAGDTIDFAVYGGVANGTTGLQVGIDLNSDPLPAPLVTTLAGSGTAGYADGAGTAVQFNGPGSVAVDSVGNLFVADYWNNRIRKVSTNGMVSTLAGSGTPGYADGPGTTAQFNKPAAVTVDTSGNVIVSDDHNCRIRKVSTNGTVSTLAGSGTPGYADGHGTAAQFYNPVGVAVDSAGNVLVADAFNNRLRMVTANGDVSTLAGSGAPGYGEPTVGTGAAVLFNSPTRVARDSAGNLYVSDQNNHSIRKITPAGVVTTLAGSGAPGYADGTGAAAQFGGPRGLAVDSAGNVYVADMGNNRIRKITPAGVVTTLAGDVAGYVDGTGTAARFAHPTGVARDSAGNLYVTDQYNHCLRKVTPAGVVTTLAASGTAGFADGTGAAAQFYLPNGVAVDSADNVIVADDHNHCIRKVTPAGVVTTLAGSGAPGYADGAGSAAQFYYPYDVAVDNATNVYVCDTMNQRIRKITPAGLVTTLAGSGAPGYAEGAGPLAQFNFPYGLAVDSAGNVFVADQGNNRIRQITTPAGAVTYDPTADFSITQGNPNGVWSYGWMPTDFSSFNPYANHSDIGIGTPTWGRDANYTPGLWKNTTDATAGGVPPGWFSLLPGSGWEPSVLRWTAPNAGWVTVQGQFLAGAAGIMQVGVRINNQPWWSATDAGAFNLSATVAAGDTIDFAVYGGGYANGNTPLSAAVTLYPSPVLVSTLAGYGGPGYMDTPAVPGPLVMFNEPNGLAQDSAGNVYVADGSNHRIRRITPAGVVTTLAGSGAAGYADGFGTTAQFNYPQGVAMDSAGNVYVADTQNQRIRKVTPEGAVTTLAGSGAAGYADGAGTAAQFNSPAGLAVDSAGNVYAADMANQRIRKVTPEGVVTTLAGSGAQGYADGAGLAAQFNYPYGVAVDSAGNVYVGDFWNQRLRKITPAGVVTTLAGSGTAGNADGAGTAAQFSNPCGVAVDSAGYVYVADHSNHRIRKVSPAGVVTTLAGLGTAGFTDGTGTAAAFYAPTFIAVDSAGNVFVADFRNQRVRKVTPAGEVSTFAGSGVPGYGDSTNSTGSAVMLGWAAEEGIDSGLAVCFDTWDDNPEDSAPGITIKFDGAEIAGVAMSGRNAYPDAGLLPTPMDPASGQPMRLETGNEFVPVELVLRNGGGMDVYFKGVKVLANIATGYTPRTGRFTLGARTGGSLASHWIEDLNIVVNENAAAGALPFANSVATNLNSWLTGRAVDVGRTFFWPDSSITPRVVNQTVYVGDRIDPPANELGSMAGQSYLAGYINTNAGVLFNPNAYIDLFAQGFEAANRGAIIPVNAIPGGNRLEVWWCRTNNAQAGVNAGNTSLGFQTIYWPSAVGHYTIQWPVDSREIVLASKLGSGTLDSPEALGGIYRQNDPALPGYNPNEEHALMSGGMAFATRDDLNITSGANYSSDPFVLVEYTAADGRPAMSAFKVLREKPEAGYVFDYIAPAGQILQPPMPLPLLAKPVEGSGDNAKNYNIEPDTAGGDIPVGWVETRDAYAYAHYKKFTLRDRHQDVWIYRGLHAGLPKLEAGSYVAANGSFAALPNATAVVGSPFQFTLHASRQDEYLVLSAPARLPDWLGISGLSVIGTPGASDVGTKTIELVVADLYDQSLVTNSLTLAVVAAGSVRTQPPLALVCSNHYSGTVLTFTNRPPFLAGDPAPSNSFTMRYYYKTEASFDWPGLANPPAAGSIVPYLRPIDPDTGDFVGDPASKSTESLEIAYRPVWPVRDPKDSSKPLPTLPFGATLTMPRFDLPGVRDMQSAWICYQQSAAMDIASHPISAMLHDPTRAKFADLAEKKLNSIPGGVPKDYYQGRYYFPTLPPHLATRLYYDPNRGTNGSLALKGEFVEETLGESYLQLNVLRGSDLAAAKDLCPPGSSEKSAWDALVNALATTVETFYENPNVPGTYIPDLRLTKSVGVEDLTEITSGNTAVDSYALSATGPGGGYVVLLENEGAAFTEPGDPVSMHIFKVGGSDLYRGEVKVIPAGNPLSEQVTFQHTADLAGRFAEYDYQWKIAAPVDGLPPASDADMSHYIELANGLDMPRHMLGGAGIRALCDNYVVMRYRAKSPSHPLFDKWSEWTSPKLSEGWIKRVLAGINPFNQRVKDLFNNRVNTDVSILTQAGKRWEGDVALNMETINKYGLIEIYETVLRRGRMLSVESGYNYGPANDALLLAAGYLNDLYMMIGGEAWADAANPTIGIGTKDRTYADIATALFAFKGQVPSLLAEELALLCGRDDFLMPGVEVPPVYNRLVWNYTRGIDSGEVIYALNYNIQENPNATPDGNLNAEDAALMFPQGHGDAYGHYLTALKGYYSLLINSRFDWVPRIEAVNVLGQPVSVDYMDERKFAAASAALARAGRQVFDLVWRKDYQPVQSAGWAHLGHSRLNTTGWRKVAMTRYWGADHWAARTGQGAYLHWIVGNAILPAVDPNPLHEGIQKIDRTTVPELTELVTLGDGVQTGLDNAEGGLTPLGVPEGGITFDINPNIVVNADNGTHFDQIYQRTKTALNNAVASFDDAKDVTRLMRSEQDSLADFQAQVAKQELAYNNALIELFGTPYPEDIGPGKTWKQDYGGPDLIHYAYVEMPEYPFPELWSYTTTNTTFHIDVQDVPKDFASRIAKDVNWTVGPLFQEGGVERRTNNVEYIEFRIGSLGFLEKPNTWTGQRRSPGKIQQAISEYIMAHTRLRQALNDSVGAKNDLDKATRLFQAELATRKIIKEYKYQQTVLDQTVSTLELAGKLYEMVTSITKDSLKGVTEAVLEAMPKSLIAGLAAGGDLTSPARAAAKAAGATVETTYQWAKLVKFIGIDLFSYGASTTKRWLDFDKIGPLERELVVRERVLALNDQLSKNQGLLWTINERLRELDDAARNRDALIAEGERIQDEREVYRQRAAAVIQGYRTRDAAFRLFRNEKLERYKTLFDLAARYSLLAANAYDYETGLLGTSAGRDFKARIINARALGVVRNGEPQYAGSDTGDPGLSSALAEMKADWDVLRGRLGFNNPDAYGTTVSLRTEALRILPTSDSDANWQDVLQAARQANILEDPDVRRYCMQIDDGSGLPVPGLVLTFGTTIAKGYNVFGRELAAGDHQFILSAFATKIFGMGVAFVGYRGMDDPAANSGAVSGVGGSSPGDPSLWYLDPLALAATPQIYLIPVGVDAMRTPPLGDANDIRTWNVDDLAIPMPFNIGASGFSTQQLWQSSDSLTEPLFAIRKHQAFRPVSSTSVFTPSLYGDTGSLRRSQFTNNRLVGRSAWNSQWKLVIPGFTLLNDPNAGLDRFIQTVTDVKLHFVTYSYSGN